MSYLFNRGTDSVHDSKRILNRFYRFTYIVSLVPLRFYDIFHGTEYSRAEETGDKDGRYEYYPSPVFSFPFLRRYIRKHMQNGRGHSVLDIGCGKGFVLLFFSRLCFDTVSGIEYDKRLCRLARTNLNRIPQTVNVYQEDAAVFSMYQDYDTFYMYNPFDEKILEKCIDKILLSLDKRPRNLTVFYCNPLYGDVLRKRGFEEREHFYYKTTVFVFHGKKQTVRP